jgi:hydroxypyruvate isomerase
MPRFAANLSMLYPEHAFLDRFEAAARDGFQAVEYLFPYDFEPQELAARPAGQRPAAGAVQRAARASGTPATRPGLPARARAGVPRGLVARLRYAQALGCPRVHVMAGLVPKDAGALGPAPVYIENLRWAAREAAQQGVNLLLEPINTRDIPGFFLNRQDDAHQLLSEIGALNVQVQMDLYHCQIVEGDVAMKIRQYLPTGRVGHFQIAGVPQRHEPGPGRAEPRLPVLRDRRGLGRLRAGTAGSAASTGRRAAAQAGGLSDGLGLAAPPQVFFMMLMLPSDSRMAMRMSPMLAVGVAQRLVEVAARHPLALSARRRRPRRRGPPAPAALHRGVEAAAARTADGDQHVQRESVAAAIRPPGSDSSWPLIEPLTASDSSITTTRSKGVNWPTVRLPLMRTIASSAM